MNRGLGEKVKIKLHKEQEIVMADTPSPNKLGNISGPFLLVPTKAKSSNSVAG